MSNPNHPQFAHATVCEADPVATLPAARPPATPRHDAANEPGATAGWLATLGTAILGLGLWVFLIAQLASKFSPPSVL